MCLAQAPQCSDAGEAQPTASLSRVKHSITEPLRSYPRSYIISLIHHFEADILWKVSLKILNSGLILKTFTHAPNDKTNKRPVKTQISLAILLDLILYVQVNIFRVMSGRVFLCCTSTKQGLMCLAQGYIAVTRTRNPSILSQALPLSHCSSISLAMTVIWPQGYKTFFMLKSIENEIYPADIC